MEKKINEKLKIVRRDAILFSVSLEAKEDKVTIILENLCDLESMHCTNIHALIRICDYAQLDIFDVLYEIQEFVIDCVMSDRELCSYIFDGMWSRQKLWEIKDE